MIYLLLTTLIWAFSFGLIGNVLKGLDPLMVSGVRLAIALLVFLPLLKVRGLSSKDRLALIALGAVQFGVMYICYLSAFRFIPSHLVALFSVLTPVYVVLIHDLKRRNFTPPYLLAALLSVGGAAVIRAKTGDSGDLWTGFTLMQISGLAFAYGQVAYREWKRPRPELHNKDIMGLLYAGGALTALAASFALSSETGRLSDATPQQLGVIVYLGVVASGLGFLFWNKGATLSSAGVLGAFNNVLIPLAMFVSLFVFGEIEDVSGEQLIRLAIGGSLIGIAVWVAHRSSLHAESA